MSGAKDHKQSATGTLTQFDKQQIQVPLKVGRFLKSYHT